MIRFIFAALAASTVMTTPAAAQTPEEQAFLPSGVADIACDVGGGLIEAIFGRGAGDLARRGARALGVCDEEETGGGSTRPNPTPDRPAPALEPGLQVKLVAVRPQAEGDPRVEPASPETSFRVNDGFAAIVSNNAPGYLEIWSVDDRSANFIEAHVLTQASNVVLPKATLGYYRFTTAGGSDRLRLRFRPCRVGDAQAFEPQANAAVAARLSEQQQVASQLAATLPICTFSQNVDLTQANTPLFGSATPRSASFSSASGVYTVTSAGGRAFVTDIALKRE
jgi:hypothetical protein